jgi:hypothetical protein
MEEEIGVEMSVKMRAELLAEVEMEEKIGEMEATV